MATIIQSVITSRHSYTLIFMKYNNKAYLYLISFGPLIHAELPQHSNVIIISNMHRNTHTDTFLT